MKYTTNYNLKKPEGTDIVNIDDLNDNVDILDNNINSLSKQINNLSSYATANGTNTYTATIAGITTLTEGFSAKIKFTNTNTGACTLNINGLGAKSILKGNGNALSSGNIKAGQICNLVYNGINFQLLGEGGEYGTATASDVLSGKTIGTDAGVIEGTIPIKEAATILPGTIAQAIAAGQYLKGIQTIAGDLDLVPANIKSGVDIFGVVGSAPIPSGSALAAQVLAGYTFSNVSGVGLSGTMHNNGNIAATLTAQEQQYTVPAGYHAGSGKVTANISNLIAENIKKGVNVGGIVGTLKPNYNIQTLTFSGNFTVPKGVDVIEVFMIGGGTGGNRAPQGDYIGGKGGRSGSVISAMLEVTAGQIIPYVIGAGSAGAPQGNGNLPTITDGGITTFGSLSTANGPFSPTVNGTQSAGNNGVATNTLFIKTMLKVVYSGGAGGGIYGNAATAGGTSGGGGNGGASQWGSPGGNGIAGSPATVYGCGGGGGGTGSTGTYAGGGAGKQGAIYVGYYTM